MRESIGPSHTRCRGTSHLGTEPVKVSLATDEVSRTTQVAVKPTAKLALPISAAAMADSRSCIARAAALSRVRRVFRLLTSHAQSDVGGRHLQR